MLAKQGLQRRTGKSRGLSVAARLAAPISPIGLANRFCDRQMKTLQRKRDRHRTSHHGKVSVWAPGLLPNIQMLTLQHPVVKNGNS